MKTVKQLLLPAQSAGNTTESQHRPGRILRWCLIAILTVWTALDAAAESRVRIVAGPYLQCVGEEEFTIVWVTDGDALSWVEVAPDDGSDFYACVRKRYFESIHGKHPLCHVHRITVSGLKPATRYRYRIFSQAVAENRGNAGVLMGRIASSSVYKHEPFYATTLDPQQNTLECRIVNDIHSRDSVMRLLLHGVSPETTDLVILNGDMTSTVESEQQIVNDYLHTLSDVLGGSVPFRFVRGNHENRGAWSYRVGNYFPTPEGRFYYAFRQGPAFFVVLDCGEDKPDNDIEYFGLAAFDSYREIQARWLRSVIESDAFRDAPVRIVLLHIPPVHYDWHGGREIQRLFMPLLQGAGVDLMICAHLHRHYFTPAGESEYDFPVLINSNNECVHLRIDGQQIEAEIRDTANRSTALYRLKK